MNILITGASGFIGGKLFNFLLKHHPNDFIYGTGRKQLPLHNYFSCNLECLEDIKFPITPDIVIHCAARSSPWGTYQDFYNANVVATQNVITYCIQHHVRKLIYISSSSVFYHNTDQLNLSEDSPIGPEFVNHYAKTKYLGEQLVQQQFPNHVILRPRAVYGPGDTVLLPRILKAAQKWKLPQIKNKTVIGDLIFIDNLCHYISKACHHTVSGSFNLTDGKPVVIHEFLSTLLHGIGHPVRYFSVNSSTAMMAAKIMEWFYQHFRPHQEPPLTQFGVGVFSYSKTFNPTHTQNILGLPPYTSQEGIQLFIESEKLKE